MRLALAGVGLADQRAAVIIRVHKARPIVAAERRHNLFDDPDSARKFDSITRERSSLRHVHALHTGDHLAPLV
jgi:hypothetical protein